MAFTEDISKNLYQSTLGQTPKAEADALVKVGGESIARFVPNINASKWNDECWLNINNSDVAVISEKQTFVDGKVDLIVGNCCHRYYITPEGKLEYEILFSSIPASFVIDFELQFQKGLKFYYQPLLTQEQKDAEIVRPENVEGSYAVYWQKKNNKYQTGKFAHIYRPKLIDAKGNVSWCDLLIDGNVMQIKMDDIWLNKASYPVCLDPEIGYHTEGGSSTFWGANQFYGSVFTSAADADTLTNIFIYCRSYGGGADRFFFKGVLALHADLKLVANGVGAPTQTDQSWTWKESAFSTSPTLVPSTDYLLGWIGSNTADEYKWDTGEENQGHIDDSNSYTTPQDLGAVIHNNNVYSVYGEYVAAGGATAVPATYLQYLLKKKRTSWIYSLLFPCVTILDSTVNQLRGLYKWLS